MNPELLRALGVTRIARVTGLDRAFVEVACAVRPGGHVLQVCNGKGLDAAQAEASALGEAAELWGAERVDAGQLVFARARELGGSVIAPAALGATGPLAEARLAFRPAQDLYTGVDILVPAQAVHCPPAGTPLGPSALRWTSNGMGAHPDPQRALLHALLEAAERDGLSRALPHGWTGRSLSARKLDPATLADGAPRTAALRERLFAHGLRAHLFDLCPKRWLGLPLAGALLADDEEGPLPLTAGYACALDRDEALLGALLEAAQSRLTDVHGAREDVAPPDRAAALALAAAARAARPRLDAASIADAGFRGRNHAVHALLERFAAAGVTRAAAVQLAPAGFPLSIVKVLVPSFRLSELL